MSEFSESLESKLPSVTMDDLCDLAERLQAAEARLAHAEQALADDEARRGLLARLSDLVSETVPETALGNAAEVVQKLRGLGAKTVARWLEKRPAELAIADASAPEKNAAVRRYLDLSRRHDKLYGWYQLAATAVSTIESAARRCHAAANIELADALTGSAAISLGSTTAASIADDAVQEARQVIARLRAALPQRGVTMQVEDIDDSFDAFVDLLIRPDFDILSWNNRNRLAALAEKLEVTARMLTPLQVHLGQKADATLALLEPMTPEAQSIITAYAAARSPGLASALRVADKLVAEAVKRAEGVSAAFIKN